MSHEFPFGNIFRPRFSKKTEKMLNFEVESNLDDFGFGHVGKKVNLLQLQAIELSRKVLSEPVGLRDHF